MNFLDDGERQSDGRQNQEKIVVELHA
jgi:hypothetical protein